MARRSDHSRDELRDLALGAAAYVLAKEGPDRLTTRAVAARIGYTAGSLYLVFQNRADLVWRLNAQTLDELYSELEASIDGIRASADRLRALARSYVRFAFEHEARWRLIFDQPLPNPMPDWLKDRTGRIFDLVEPLLLSMNSRQTSVSVGESANALWAGVHGVCMLGLTGRLDQNDIAAVQSLADSLVANYLAGFGQRCGAAPDTDAKVSKKRGK